MEESKKRDPNKQRISFNKVYFEGSVPQTYQVNHNHEFGIKIDALIKRIDNMLEA